MTHKIKILFLHHSARCSGSVRQLMNIFENLNRNIFEPILVIQRSDKVFNKALLLQPNVYVLNDTKAGKFSMIRNFISLVRQIQPDCIQTFNRRSNWLGYVSSCFYKSPPIISSMRNSNSSYRYLLVEMFFKSCFRFMVVNSKAIYDELRHRAFIPDKKLKIIPNGLNTELFTAYPKERIDTVRNDLFISKKTTVLLSVGRIHRQKNILCTLRALIEIKTLKPELDFLFIHVGPVTDRKYFNTILNYVYENNLQCNCLFEKETKHITDYYNAADAVILSSSWEGLPNVLIEAMACNKPCLVATSADNDHIIISGKNGFLFQNDNHQDLARLIDNFSRLSVETKRQIGLNARETVESRFSMQVMVSRFEELYRQVTQNTNHTDEKIYSNILAELAHCLSTRP